MCLTCRSGQQGVSALSVCREMERGTTDLLDADAHEDAHGDVYEGQEGAGEGLTDGQAERERPQDSDGAGGGSSVVPMLRDQAEDQTHHDHRWNHDFLPGASVSVLVAVCAA